MSLEVEGALNRLTAAVLALAVEYAKDENRDYTQAVEDVEYNYEKRLKTVLDSDE